MLRALRGQQCERPPIWLMRQAGRYLPEYRLQRAGVGNFLDLCYTPELAAEVSLQPIRRFGFDAAILFSDILVIPDALGQTVHFEESVGPVLSPPVTDRQGIKRLKLSGLSERLNPIYETVRLLRASLPPAVALIGFAGGPWTVASYMVAGGASKDQAAAREFAYRHPADFAQLMDLLVDATAIYLTAQARAGAEVLQLFDSWAGVLPEPEFYRWCITPTQRIIARVRDYYPKVPFIGFPKGAGPLYADYARATGVAAVNVDTALPIEWAKDHLQPLVTVQGNLDPYLLVAGGAAMQAQTRQILERLGRNGRFIFNLGHGIAPHTPLEHVEQLVSMVKNWRN